MKDSRNRSLKSYHLSPQQLQEIHRKYGNPGEIAPGRQATRKRNRLETTLASMDRRDVGTVIPFNEENEAEPDFT